MTHPAAGLPHPRPPDREPHALLAGLTPEQAAGRPPRPRPAADRRRARHRQDPHAHAPRRAPARHRRRRAPREILAVTFSVRAAGELRLRLADLLGEAAARGVLAATFHSVCARLLREHAALFGRTDAYTIYDQADLRRVIEALLADHRRRDDPGRRSRAAGSRRRPSSRPQLALAKSRLLDARALRSPRAATRPRAVVAAVWRARRRASSSAATRSPSTTCSSSRSGCCASTRTGSRTCAAAGAGCVVDEMQDTNEAQATLVHLLAGAGRQRDRASATTTRRSTASAAPSRATSSRFGERYPRHARGRARAQLPLARRDPHRRRALHRAQPSSATRRR